jgi:hypothetical protein
MKGMAARTPFRFRRLGRVLGALGVSTCVSLLPLIGAAADRQRDLRKYAAIKQWRAEVIVTSDCDRTGPDGSRTMIHNRTVTDYEFTHRTAEATSLTWSGRATTTYRWSVGTEFRGTRDIEESSASYESDGKLTLSGSTTIVSGRVPGRPFTRKKLFGESLIENSTADDEPPVAELAEAPLPSEAGVTSGTRLEDAYTLLSGLLLPCPAQRQWTIRASS